MKTVEEMVTMFEEDIDWLRTQMREDSKRGLSTENSFHVLIEAYGLLLTMKNTAKYEGGLK